MRKREIERERKEEGRKREIESLLRSSLSGENNSRQQQRIGIIMIHPFLPLFHSLSAALELSVQGCHFFEALLENQRRSSKVRLKC